MDDTFTDNYIKMNQEKLSECHEFLALLLDKHRIEYMHGCNAGFFLWVNLGKRYLEAHPDEQKVRQREGQDEWGTKLTDVIFQKLLDNKVYVAHGTAYGSEKPGWFRLVFSHPLPWLEEAMARIIRAITQ